MKSTRGAVATLYVSDQKDAIVAESSVENGEWTIAELTFTVPKDGSYRLGVAGSVSGSVLADDFELVRD